MFDLLGLELTPAQIEAFASYAGELLAWNQRMNLTAIRDLEEVRKKHFLDSLSCWLAMRTEPLGRVVDVGSGAGFPGIPLKILQPGMPLTLIESVGKKASFLEHIVQVLGLSGVEVWNVRAEEAGRMAGQREAYDWAVARALAPLPVLAEYLLPLLKAGGSALAQKGGNARQEADAAKPAIELLGGGEPELLEVNVPGLDERRSLVWIRKIAPTPENYPRRPGIPAKRPL